ncbi:XRE family transcriptional regulator [Pseudomonas sp. M47T1]|uniref:helix-turn-helix domain-containing protein n=1 Tax=Pseudomonas sp. M47T1 TaxID=1179778 RepID=UPI0002608B01|nr:helix-turn-helix transcriptional regulator [Pseudomonas sp. M47T1]EIK95517.1 XRE family transcriptional regulator [Pseudomonas sp. M47T1]
MTSNESINPGAGILKKTQLGLSANLLRAMQVSGLTETGEPKKLSQQRLAQTSGIARSTISKYLTQHTDANPDLETLCRLASALNISPALLLMSEGDWLQLARALLEVGHVRNNESISNMIEELGSEQNNRPLTRAATVMRMAKYVGVNNHNDSALSRKMQQGILATSAMPMHPDFEQGIYTHLLPLCIVMGARIIDQENHS